MSYNNYMYAVDRSDEYLAHYGIKGMKWGVRKAIESGSERRLARQYKKAQKKLAKLKKQASNQEKYNKRAARLGAGAALAGGLAAAGTGGVASAMRKGSAIGGKAAKALGTGIANANSAALIGINRSGFGKTKTGKAIAAGLQAENRLASRMVDVGSKLEKGEGKINTAASGLETWGKGTSGVANKIADSASRRQIDALRNAANRGNAGMIANARAIREAASRAIEDQGRQIWESNRAKAAKYGNRDLLVRAGAGALAAGLGGAAVYNKYRASHTDKAAKKAQQFESEMNKAFAGTKYGKKQRRRR